MLIFLVKGIKLKVPKILKVKNTIIHSLKII
jgi:hypothetical protein